MKQKERKDIPKDSTWDLKPLYSSAKKWEEDFASLDKLLKAANRLKGKLGDSPVNLKMAYEKLDQLSRTLEKVYVFAHLKSDEDLSNSKNTGTMNRVTAKFAEIQGATAWFVPEALALPDSKIKKYLKSEELSFYKRALKELLRNKSHMLSAGEEKILGMASDALSTPSKTFSALNNADIQFPSVKDSSGKSIELTHGNYIKFLESGKREIRKTAFKAMYDTFGKYRNTFATTLSGAVKTHALNAKIRNFPSALDASLHPDNVPRQVYENLIESVNANLKPFYDYLELRRKVLKIRKLDMYDLHAPIVKGCKSSFSWEDACENVIEAVAPLGEEYVKEVKKGFASRWVDVYESKGKRSGAYSSGCFDSYPYILMNFQGNLNDVFTLAHELGHSMHSLLSRKNQEYHYADYKIFVAEVASTTNEILLHHSLTEKSEDEKFKLYLLSHLADGIRGTVYRQTMFAEYEKKIHEDFEKGVPLTADSLTESYYALNKKYHGPKVNPDEGIGMEWARIPHFYYNFYVYKYATGFSAAAALSKGIIEGDSKKIEAYLNFLKAGSTKDVLDIMKDAGVDLTTPKPVEDTMDLFAATVKQLKKGLGK
jgi:oligoendopeptidase F